MDRWIVATLARHYARPTIRSWSTSVTAPARSPRSNWPIGCARFGPTSGCSGSRSTRRASRPRRRAGPAPADFRARRLRAGWSPSASRPGRERPAAIRRSRGRRCLADRPRRARARRHAHRGHVRRARAAGRLGPVGRRRGPRTLTLAAQRRASPAERPGRATAEGADPSQRRGTADPPPVRGSRSFVGRRGGTDSLRAAAALGRDVRPDCRKLAGAGRTESLAPRGADRRLGVRRSDLNRLGRRLPAGSGGRYR